METHGAATLASIANHSRTVVPFLVIAPHHFTLPERAARAREPIYRVFTDRKEFPGMIL